MYSVLLFIAIQFNGTRQDISRYNINLHTHSFTAIVCQWCNATSFYIAGFMVEQPYLKFEITSDAGNLLRMTAKWSHLLSLIPWLCRREYALIRFNLLLDYFDRS